MTEEDDGLEFLPERPELGKGLMTRREAAEWLGMSLRWLDKQLAAGRIRVVRIGPKTVRIKPDELKKFLERRSR